LINTHVIFRGRETRSLRNPGRQSHATAAISAFAGFFKPLRASPRWLKLAGMMNLPEKV